MKWILNIGILFFAAQSVGQVAFYNRYTGSNFDQGRGMVQLPDDGYAVTGSHAAFNASSNAYIIRIADNGDYLWSKTYGTSGTERGQRIFYEQGTGFWVMGYANNPQTASFDFYAFQTDEDGELLWESNYGTADWERLWDAVRLDNGDFILVGEKTGDLSDNEDMFLVRITENGDEVWTQTFSTSGKDIAYAVNIMNDTTILIAGEMQDLAGLGRPTILSMHIDGTLNWQQFYDAQGEGFFRGVQFFEDRIYACGGVVPDGDELMSIYMIRAMNNGNVEFFHVSPADGDEYLSAMHVADEHSFYVVMISNAPQRNVYPEGVDQFLLKYHTLLFWNGLSRSFSGFNDDIAYQVIGTSDDGAALVSTVSDNWFASSQGSMICVAKVGPNGETATLTTTSPILSSPELEATTFRVYPNPFQEQLHVEIPHGLIGAYELQDATGKRLQSGVIQDVIHTQELPTGIYFLRLFIGNEIAVMRLVKTN
jgi:hypothetical protein